MSPAVIAAIIAAAALVIVNLFQLISDFRDRVERRRDRDAAEIARLYEERFRNIRWAAELQGSPNQELASAGTAALGALDTLPGLTNDQSTLLDALLDTTAEAELTPYTSTTEYVYYDDPEGSQVDEPQQQPECHPRS